MYVIRSFVLTIALFIGNLSLFALLVLFFCFLKYTICFLFFICHICLKQLKVWRGGDRIEQFCGLNVNCPPQTQVCEYWVPSGWAVWGSCGSFWTWGLERRHKIIGARPECYGWDRFQLGTWFLFSGCDVNKLWNTLQLSCSPHHIRLCSLKPWLKMNLSSLNCFRWVFCYMMNTVINASNSQKVNMWIFIFESTAKHVVCPLSVFIDYLPCWYS